MNKLNNFDSYLEYLDTGIEFIGQIPKHWKVEKLKHTVKGCFNGVWGDPPTGDDNDTACIRVADFNRNNRTVNIDNLTYRNIQKKYQNSRLLRYGDLLLEKSGGGENQPVGCVVFFNQNFDAISSNFIGRMPVRDNYDSQFLNYLHWFLYDSKINTKSIKQTTGIQNIDQDAYLSEEVGIPPLPEQRAIANFLDHQTAKIDALIEKQERLIILLEEKRNTLIAQAVTKGLDPDAPMKDSGVEWLGKIPEHWKTRKAKWLFKEKKDKNHPEEILLSVTQDNGVISREESEINVWNPGDDVSGYKLIKPGQFVISLRSFQGGIEYSRIRGIVSPAYVVMKPLISQYNEFFRYLLKSDPVISALENLTTGIRQGKNINFDDFILLECPLPPLSEANRIVNHLNNELEKINKLVDQVKDLLGKIHEYRSSLISAAVTGKIDVRGWQEKEIIGLE